MAVHDPDAAARTRGVFVFVGALLGAGALVGLIQQASGGAPLPVVALRAGQVLSCAALVLLARRGRERLGMMILIAGIVVCAMLEWTLA